MRFAVIAFAGLALSACVSTPVRWAQESDFHLAVQDNNAQRRFDLALKSTTEFALCLSSESWPSADGLPAGFDGATLTTTGGAREVLPMGSAYCPGGCGEVRIEPGQTLQGMIPYSAFGDASTLAAEDLRALTFDVQPYICSE